MEKKKPNMSVQYIDNKVSRNVTFCKRKRGLIKKAMEISILCGQEVSLILYD